MRDALRTLASTIYIGPFRNPVNIGTNTGYFDIQVGQSFITNWRQFKSGNIRAQNDAAHRVEAEIQRIFELSGLEVNAGPEDKTLQVFVNHRSFQLGSALVSRISLWFSPMSP